MEGVNQEDIEQYSFVFFSVYKWAAPLIEINKDGITKRREIKEKEEEERDQTKADHEEWLKTRKAARDEAQKEFHKKQLEAKEEPDGEDDDEGKPADEKPVFNEEEFFRKYDEEYPKVVIPAEVVEDAYNNYEVGKEDDE